MDRNKEAKLKENVKRMIRKAYRSLRTARTDLKDGDSDSASSRAYYAVFYMMEAALLAKGLSFSKHSAVISAFNRHFIKEEIFPKVFSKEIARLFKDRQIGDYDFVSTLGEEEAVEDMEAAEEIVRAVEEYLRKELRLDAQ